MRLRPVPGTAGRHEDGRHEDGPVADLRVVHTADLGTATADRVRALLDTAYAGDFADEDWEHCLGGLHAVLEEDDGTPVGHAALVQRRLLHRGRALRAGYVEGVAVRPDRRRRGHAGTLMGALERVVAAAYDLGALSTSDGATALYAGRGWRPWRGPTSVLAPTGVRPTPDDDGGVYVLPGTALPGTVLPGTVPLDLDAALTCDWRDGDVW